MSTDAASMLRSALHEVTRNLVERETLVELIALAAVAGEHVLIVGPPGTAKSVAVRRMASAIGGRYFEYLLGRFTEPSEIFGPVDLRELREGVIKTDTSGMLPEAEIAFLDEVFLGSTAILNTLLGLLNERIFRRGHTEMHCPLRVCVGASNRLPDDPALDAFADRFLVHAFVEPVVDPMLELLLESGDALSRETFTHRTDIETLDALVEIARQIDIGPVRGTLADALRELRHAGIGISDRRAVNTQRLIAAASAIAGRDIPTAADLWPLVFAIPTAEGQSIAREVLHDRLAPSEKFAGDAPLQLRPLARAAVRATVRDVGLGWASTSPRDYKRLARMAGEDLLVTDMPNVVRRAGRSAKHATSSTLPTTPAAEARPTSYAWPPVAWCWPRVSPAYACLAVAADSSNASKCRPIIWSSPKTAPAHLRWRDAPNVGASPTWRSTG